MVRLKGFKELTPVDDALNIFFNKLKLERLESLYVPIGEALGRVTACNIIAEKDLPSFNRSAMDGYALNAIDTVEASLFKPSLLSIVEKEAIEKGEAKQIWTGGALPKGADAVVMLEHTKKTGHDRIEVLAALTPGGNVSKKGEDVKKGEVVVETGVRLKPRHLGLLASLGMRKVEVVRKPRVAVLATGNELVALNEEMRPHKIVEANSVILSGMSAELGAEAFSLGIAKDDENEITEKILEGLAKADLVLTTGGTSVGAHDLVPKAVEQISCGSVVVHGMAMRPGMPTALAVVDRKPVAILSGNPVAAMVGFEVFCRPLIQRLQGLGEDRRIGIRARLRRRVAGVLGRRVFLRVEVVEKSGEFFAEPLSVKGSSVITTMTKADGYVVIPENREGLRENELVFVHLFDR